jgi:TolB-like protein/AraC-like DNA-binding protein/Tfp pilus assembly protein PilF
MTQTPQEIEFLNQLNARIEENFAQEEFGVSELAEAMNMSRSNLLRKVKKTTDLSVSQLISQARLQRGMILLRTTSANVSEVAHQVGFNSTSYFIKCFRENYGYPPGEVGKHDTEPIPITLPLPPPAKSNRKYWAGGALVLLVVAIGWLAYQQRPFEKEAPLEKSIVVLPFKNDSGDSSNLYIINGLMETTLNNLQKIKELKVLSRTSAEKYRNSHKSIPEIAKELNVSYFVEGSGQKLDDRIVLNIQIIDGSSDRHLWSRQYRRDTKDIFALQQEIAKDIAEEIQVVITPEEKQRIEKICTNNMEAYDSFLKGVDLVSKGGDENLHKGIIFLKQAVAKDNSFALAYAVTGMAYYYLDMFRAEKKYIDELGSCADKALLYDPKLGEGFTAKAMYYMIRKDYQQALPYLEKGLEENPNSTRIIGFLADYYSSYMPNTGKHLEYALKGMRLGAGSNDSVSVSYDYLRVGNALAQAGFVNEALKYVDKSLEHYSGNRYSRYLKAFILYAKNKDLNQTRELLRVEFKKDTTRFDILQDLGKVSYYMKDFETACQYYDRFIRVREAQKLDIYVHEHMIFGVAYEKTGQIEKAKKFIASYKQFIDTDKSSYQSLGMAMYHAHAGEHSKALEFLKRFAKEDNVQYWVILFLDKDPMLEDLIGNPECKKALDDIEKKFWANHDKLKIRLQEQGLL